MPVPDLTVAEVAVRLKMTPLTIRRRLGPGAPAGIARDDRAACRIRETDLETFLDARRRRLSALTARRAPCGYPATINPRRSTGHEYP
jgi:hypothetical protein